MTGDVAFVDLTTLDSHQKREKRQSSALNSEWVGGSSALYLNDWQIAALKGVYKVRALRSNWDNEGGEPPSRQIVNFAKTLIASLPYEDLQIPFVVPTSCGGIQFEWSEGQKELELEILPDCSLEFLKVENGSPFDEGPVALPQVYSLFKWLHPEPESQRKGLLGRFKHLLGT